MATDPRVASDIERYQVLGNVVYWTSLAAHAVVVLAFHLIDQLFLSVFNIGSVIVITGAIVSHGRGKIRLGYALYTVEIVAHAVAATWMLGWETGFFVYLTIPLMIMPLLPRAGARAKLGVSLGLLAVLVILLAMAHMWPPERPLAAKFNDLLLIGNFVLMTLISGAFMYVFSQVIQAVEGRLVNANRNLRRFSGAVSDFLDPMLVEKLNEGADVAPRTCFLTVLFSDLVGSTRLSQNMDDDAYGAMIDEYAGTMHGIIKHHGGYVEDISGDGVLAYVGNMESAGKRRDAGAVVEMAMQRELRRLNTRFLEIYHLPWPLRARIGISSGPAFVGKSSGVRSVYTANGASVNLGSKLEQGLKTITDQGGILVSAETAALIGMEIGVPLRRHQLLIGGDTVTAFMVDTDHEFPDTPPS